MAGRPVRARRDCSSAANGARQLGPGDGLRVEVFGQLVEAHARSGGRFVRLGDLVPVVRRLTDRVVKLTLRAAAHAGKPSHCGARCAGCAACCRYLVPLSAPEAFALARDLAALPAGRRKQLQAACRAASRRVLEAVRRLPPADGDAAAWRSYAELRIDCPFLVAGRCAIYDRRPLACRTYHVVSDPAYCLRGGAAGSERLAMPFSPVQALCRLAAELEGSPPQAVLLALAPDWAAGNAERAGRRYPLRSALRRLEEIIRERVAALTDAAQQAA